MAQLKQLSAGSSQIIMMMFRDKNNAPIKADSVHVKGSIFTGSGKPFEFEVNKGVCTNCKIQNDMLLFNIVPLLGLGQMQVYTQTFLGDAKAITGTYISENQQKLGVEVVQKGTFLSDRQGAMRLVMMGYKGTDPTTSPKLLSYNNGQPQYNAGWTEIDSLFIAENAVSDRHKETKTFTFQSADNYEACTFLLRPENGAVPVNVTIYDIEGDIKPGFVFAGVKELYTAEQMTLIKKDMFTKSAILCPIAYSAYRYTFNTDDTKIPVGIFKNNEFVRNNNAWYDAKSIGKQDQGDIEVLKSFRGSLSYSLNIFNEQATDSSVTIWLARVEKDGTFTKIADSEMVVSVSANTAPSVINEVTKPAFVHNFRKGESYRWFARADKTDGAYIQCNSGSHIPMTEIIIDVEYYTEIPEDILRENGVAKIKLMDGANEVKDPENYTIQIDVKTGAVTIKKK